MSTLSSSPFEVGYPVRFYSGGDTTREAFQKHIQEIERIYQIINQLDADKISSGDIDLSSHINAANPHPNLSLDTLGGTIPASKITGLPNNGVDTFGKSAAGYIDFENGIQLRWGGSGQLTWKSDGTGDVKEVTNDPYSLNFNRSFTNGCYRVFLDITSATASDYPALFIRLAGWDKDKLFYRFHKGVSADGAWINDNQWYINPGGGYSTLTFYIHYFAIGY